MTLTKKLKEIHDFHVSVGIPVDHYWRPVKHKEHWMIWAETGEGDSFHADNGKKEQVIQGSTHVYTHKEFDPVLDAVQTMFDGAGLSWVLTSVQYEDETNTIHYEWTWETGGKNG
jgi:hypothetical protein